MKIIFHSFFVLVGLIIAGYSSLSARQISDSARQRISINDGWRFFKYESATKADNLIYDVRPAINDTVIEKIGDLKPTDAVTVKATQEVLKPWILPTANSFITDPEKRHIRPEGNPGSNFQFVQSSFNDSAWEKVNLPHDWAIKGPFSEGPNSEVNGGMGRLPSHGVAWYRKKLYIPASDAGKSIFLDIDGAMSYAIVWLNGHLVGGWPYGYNSWQLNLTPFIRPGAENQLSIRLDNPNRSSRWYPGGGIYRNVWLVKTNPIHVGQFGTYITTNNVSKLAATINLTVTIANDSKKDANIEVGTKLFVLDSEGNKTGNAVANFAPIKSKIIAGENTKVEGSINLKNPKLWGPKPTQTPNLYVAVTTISRNGKTIDQYETRFGIRSILYDPNNGIIVNGEKIPIRGANQHHDLGALGAAFNTRAAERQLQILQEMGCNAIRMSHNPPAPELLELTDRMGLLVIDEIFDSWKQKKTPYDFHLIFPDWSEPDTRAFIRRDRNCPSVFMWSFGNEVGEQYNGVEGAAVAKRLYAISKEEDSTRPSMSAMNFAKPDMEFPKVFDVIGLNYQGEGIRQHPDLKNVPGIHTPPQYDAFHAKFPNKVIISSESSYSLSSRGVYLFPVSQELSAPLRDGRGGDSKIRQASSYEVHAVDYSSTADKVFGSLDRHPFVAGEFVWTGWDYLGEPDPYFLSRSSYSGSIDMAGFKKDRFYLYQSRWRPNLPLVHILPHWNWPERIGKNTPVHVFTSGDEAELFLNGKSLGMKKKGAYEYRLRWDSVLYEPGELKVVAYKNGKKWAENSVKTTDAPFMLKAERDREVIKANGKDLSFITVAVTDKDGLVVPRSNNRIEFSIEGPGEIVATDNGDPTNMVPFNSTKREAFNGLCLVIIRSKSGAPGTITVTAKSAGLRDSQVLIVCK
jgi:beta-galactosidase